MSVVGNLGAVPHKVYKEYSDKTLQRNFFPFIADLVKKVYLIIKNMETNNMKGSARKKSPFKATRTWNQLLRSFKEGMELKRKRWRLKSYSNCFSGAEASEWLHSYLQNHPSFGAHVTREQAFMLLQKFLENHVFEHATTVKNNQKFQDTNCLYKFPESCYDECETNKENVDVNKGTLFDDKVKASRKEKDGNSLSNILKPFSRRNSQTLTADERQHTPIGKPVGNDVPPKLKVENLRHNYKAESCMTPLALNLNNISMFSTSDGKNTYADMSTVLFDNAEEEDVFDLSLSQSSFVRSNSVKVRSRPASSDDKAYLTDLFSAKPCNFNKYNSDSIQSEIDRKNALKKDSKTRTILRKFQKGSPRLHDTSRRHTVTLGKRQSDSAPLSVNDSPCKRSKKTIVKSDSRLCSSAATTLLPRKAVVMLGEKPSFINEVKSVAPLETLSGLPGYRGNSETIEEFSKTEAKKPFSLLGRKLSPMSRRNTREILRKNKEFGKENTGLQLSKSPVSREKSMLRKSSPHRMRRRSFSQDNLPFHCKSNSVDNLSNVVGRDVVLNKKSSQKRDMGLYKAPSTWSINTIGLADGIDAMGGHQEIPITTTSQEISSQDIAETWKSVVLLSLKKLLGLESLNEYLDAGQINGDTIMKNVEWKLTEISQDVPEWLLSAMNCLIEWPSTNGQTDNSVLQDLPNYLGFERDVYRAIKEHYQTTLQEPIILCHLYPLLQECSELMCVAVPSAVLLLQHVTLLLPCWNRRTLQFLTNFMKRVTDNSQLELSRDLPNKDLVIHSFYRLIARKTKESAVAGCQDTIAIRVTAFIIEHYADVFKAPSGLRVQVDHKLAVTLGAPSFFKTAHTVRLESSIRPSSAEDSSSRQLRRHRSYCVQITKEEYERQAKELSRKAIKDLLETIQTDKYLTQKERKKRLQQIQRAYPDIYSSEQQANNDDTLSVSSSSSLHSETASFKHAPKPLFLSEKMS